MRWTILCFIQNKQTLGEPDLEVHTLYSEEFLFLMLMYVNIMFGILEQGFKTLWSVHSKDVLCDSFILS